MTFLYSKYTLRLGKAQTRLFFLWLVATGHTSSIPRCGCTDHHLAPYFEEMKTLINAIFDLRTSADALSYFRHVSVRCGSVFELKGDDWAFVKDYLFSIYNPTGLKLSLGKCNGTNVPECIFWHFILNKNVEREKKLCQFLQFLTDADETSLVLSNNYRRPGIVCVCLRVCAQVNILHDLTFLRVECNSGIVSF